MALPDLQVRTSRQEIPLTVTALAYLIAIALDAGHRVFLIVFKERFGPEDFDGGVLSIAQAYLRVTAKVIPQVPHHPGARIRFYLNSFAVSKQCLPMGQIGMAQVGISKKRTASVRNGPDFARASDCPQLIRQG